MKSLLKKIPGAAWLRPGWPDEARRLVQEAALARVLAGRQFEGACLNAGSGEGLYAPFLDGFSGVTRIAHMDLTEPNIAAQFAPGRHEDVAGSITQIPFADNSFDCCLCTEVMEHVAEDDRGFAELARVLKPGGLLLITTPTPPAPFDPAHVREGYTDDEMRAQLDRHGFEVLGLTYCFHWIMRALLVVWRWQFETLGARKRSIMPRFLVFFAGQLDRGLPLGKPWDLVVLAQRRPGGILS
ncbi:MAG TPA: class I SAM-dependent methyltransferase [Chthoniobacterales bacterium]|nr:class I SAM-dependent methyltransferase [Chthoniobacterales bacterium]